MKILYIANIRLPTEKAHGIQIMKTCEAFAAAGAELELVVPTRSNFIAEDPFTYYGVSRSFAITTVEVPDLVRFGSWGFMLSQLWFSERVRWLKSFWTSDIIYSRDAGVLAQYPLLGRTLVYEAHAKPSFIARFVARRAYKVVVIAKSLKVVYEAATVAPHNIVVAPDAADTSLFTGVPDRAVSRHSLNLPVDIPVVVYTGHLYARKGAGTLAEAAALLPDMQCVFVGGTAKHIAEFRTRYAGQKNITVVGHVPPMQVANYLRAADVLVLPNSAQDDSSRLYTSPMKLFEYMASGTPIVASRVPAIEEVLTEDEAYFFTPDDASSLAGQIKLVLADKAGAHRKAQAALKKSRGYTWDKRAQHILESL